MSVPTSPSTESNTVAVLKRIEARIQDPSRWCQGPSARTKTGRRTDADSRYATQWCVYGAFEKEIGQSPEGHTFLYLTEAAYALYPGVGGCIGVNEALGHEAVMQVVRRAIVLAEQGGSL